MDTATLDVPAPAASVRAEAARYALLRRLAPSMRHQLVVNLQPIGMIHEVMDRRLRAPKPDLADVRAGAEKIHGFTRAALRSCLDVVTWLAPQDAAVASPADGAHECAALLATGLAFRGYGLRNDVATDEGAVSLPAIRSVLTAALIECTDATAAPADIRLSARSMPAGLQLHLEVRTSAGEPGMPLTPAYRPLEVADVRALAAAEGVAFSRPAPGTTVLVFPWARCPQPQASSASTESISAGSSLAK